LLRRADPARERLGAVLVGEYAQLSFAFNYLGPTGNQRDEVTVIRRRSQEVTY
jgi:nitrate reductase alpha subunit